MSLQGKIALITGGTSGIGLATAKLFIAQGATVIITGRNAQTLAKAQEELGPEVLGIQSDAGDLEQLDEVFATIKARFDRLDVLFLNAGIAQFSPIDLQSEQGFDELVRVNLKGPYFAIQKALGLLNQGSSVIVNTSVVNQLGMPNSSAYAATKAALRAVLRPLASELSSRGIRLNAVSPGPIETPIYGKLGMSSEQLTGFSEQVVQSVPLGRFGQADEVAQAVAFLSSPASSYIQGVELAVDGGMSQV